MAGLATIPSASTLNEVGGWWGGWWGPLDGQGQKEPWMSLHVYHLYREAKGRFCPCFCGTFLGTNKSLIKINNLNDNMEIIILTHPKVGTDIFHIFSYFLTFQSN
jgi:hypothetical protein